MKGLLGQYLDTVDTSAFADASSERVSRFEGPFLPLLFPWLIAGPLLYLMQSHPRAEFFIFCGAAILSIGLYASAMIYYLRAKERHRKGLGLPDWRTKMQQKIADDMARLD